MTTQFKNKAEFEAWKEEVRKIQDDAKKRLSEVLDEAVVPDKRPTTYQKTPLTFADLPFEQDDVGRKILSGRGQEMPSPEQRTVQVTRQSPITKLQQEAAQRALYALHGIPDPNDLDFDMDDDMFETMDEDTEFEKQADAIGRSTVAKKQLKLPTQPKDDNSSSAASADPKESKEAAETPPTDSKK